MSTFFLMLFFLYTPYTALCSTEITEKEIVVITASYNNASWYRYNLDSIFEQDYTNWRLIYIADDPTDATTELVDTYITHHPLKEKVTLIKNWKRKKALENQYRAIHSCDDSAIIVIVDGDDILAHRFVFRYLNEIYSDPHVWMTYGQFIHLSNMQKGFCCPMPEIVTKNNLFRLYGNTPSHLRTFYAKLFKKIKQEDLMLNGEFFSMTADMAAMIPMIEMARENHFKFIDTILLIYNDVNSLNDHQISKDTQRAIDLHIRNLPKYEALKTLFE